MTRPTTWRKAGDHPAVKKSGGKATDTCLCGPPASEHGTTTLADGTAVMVHPGDQLEDTPAGVVVISNGVRYGEPQTPA